MSRAFAMSSCGADHGHAHRVDARGLLAHEVEARCRGRGSSGPSRRRRRPRGTRRAPAGAPRGRPGGPPSRSSAVEHGVEPLDVADLEERAAAARPRRPAPRRPRVLPAIGFSTRQWTPAREQRLGDARGGRPSAPRRSRRRRGSGRCLERAARAARRALARQLAAGRAGSTSTRPTSRTPWSAQLARRCARGGGRSAPTPTTAARSVAHAAQAAPATRLGRRGPGGRAPAARIERDELAQRAASAGVLALEARHARRARSRVSETKIANTASRTRSTLVRGRCPARCMPTTFAAAHAGGVALDDREGRDVARDAREAADVGEAADRREVVAGGARRSGSRGRPRGRGPRAARGSRGRRGRRRGSRARRGSRP